MIAPKFSRALVLLLVQAVQKGPDVTVHSRRAEKRADRGPREEEPRGVCGYTLRGSDDRERRGAKLIGAALVVGMLAGCATAPPSPPSPEAQRLVQELTARWSQFDDLRGLVEITLTRDGAVQRFDGVLLLKAPAALRFEALTPFGQPFLYLVSSGQEFTLYNVGENRALVGSNAQEGAKRWLGIPFTTEELVGLLAGYVLPLPDPQSMTLVQADGRGQSLIVNGSSWTQQIWYAPDSGLPRQVEYGGGRSPVRVVFQGESAPPSAITLTALDRPLSVAIRYRNAELRSGVSRDAFHLDLPQRVKIQRVN